MTKEQLENKLYERMSAENETFLTDLKAKPVDEIISHAYEIACRDNLLMLFEDETSLSERQLAVLNEFEHPLSQLYTDWLSRDTDEMDAFRDSIACCADDVLRKKVEEKYQDPAQPIYPNTRSEAMARGEVFEWMASRDRTLTCAGTFEKDATSAYNDGKLPAFLKEWTNTYGKDRCMFVLACTMRQRTGDERFYPPARQAAGRFAALQKQMGGHTDVLRCGQSLVRDQCRDGAACQAGAQCGAKDSEKEHAGAVIVGYCVISILKELSKMTPAWYNTEKVRGSMLL